MDDGFFPKIVKKTAFFGPKWPKIVKKWRF